MPKWVFLMTVHEAHKEYNSLIDQIRAKYELLDSGECGSVGTPVIGFFYSYFRMSWNIEAFSLCVFTSTKSPRGPPWNEGHRPRVRHETSVLEVPAQEQHEHSFYSSSTNTFITCSLYMVCRYCTSPGAPDLQARLG